MEKLQKWLTSFHQTQVLKTWESLTPDQQVRLEGQIRRADFGLLKRLYEAHQHPAESESRDFAPVIPISSKLLPQADLHEAIDKGESLLRQGKVGLVLVAGGQGTRLGFEGPKGCFPLLPDKTLFHFFAQQIQGLNEKHRVVLPWAIMTSPATDHATRTFFEEQQYFGLPADKIMFFQQGMIPSLDLQGKLMLDAPDHLAENPNGHGGTLSALKASGVLELFRTLGIEELFYFQVDNPLVKIADPLFVGLHALAGADMSTKVVEKVDPKERVGIVGLIDEKTGVIEYSELSDAECQQQDSKSRLIYRAANTAIHMIHRTFVDATVQHSDALPYHTAVKQVPHLNEQGVLVHPDIANGLKFEMFIFDALAHAKNPITLEVNRETEFAPLKNATGLDSPETVRAALKKNGLA